MAKLYFTHMKMSTRLILTYLLTLVIPIIIILVVLFNFVSKTILNQTIENLHESNRLLVANVNAVLGDYMDIANKLCYNDQIQDMLTINDEAVQYNLTSYIQMKKAILNSIIFYDYQLIAKIYLPKDSGLIDHTFFVRMHNDSAEYKLYEELSELKNNRWSSVNGKITVSKPIATYIGQPLGLAQIIVREQDIYRQLEVYPPDRHLIVIYDSAGSVVSSNNRELVGNSISEEEYFTPAEDFGFEYSANGQFVYLRESLNGSPNRPDWVIVTVVPIGDIRSLSVKVSVMGVSVIVAGFLLASAAYATTSISIVRRVNLIASRMHDAAKSVFTTLPEDNYGDELSAVTNAYNHMAESLDQLIYDNYISKLELQRTTIQKQRAQLGVLQNQMHPHFLFNTLESMRMKLQIGDIDRARQMLLSLSRVLRISLASGEGLVTLENELDSVKNYIQIQSLRFDEKFQHRIDVKKDTLQCMVPKYSVQTLVENAISHGLEPLSRNGLVEVVAERIENAVKITVTDNGVGIKPDKLNKILTPSAESDSEHRSGIGLNNISEQIKLHFGEEYGITIKSGIHGGTSVTILIPAEYQIKGESNV